MTDLLQKAFVRVGIQTLIRCGCFKDKDFAKLSFCVSMNMFFRQSSDKFRLPQSRNVKKTHWKIYNWRVVTHLNVCLALSAV